MTPHPARPIPIGMFALVVLSAALVLGTPALAQDSTNTSTTTATTTASPTTAGTTRTGSPTPVTVSVPAATSLPSGNRVTPSPDIIPRPGSGQKPRDPGDRGGWWQESLFFLMCGAVLLIAGLIWRDSRRARRRQGRLRTGTTTPPIPSDPATAASGVGEGHRS